MFLAEHVRGLFRFQVDVFQQLAEFGQFSIAFLVDFQLKRSDSQSNELHVEQSERIYLIVNATFRLFQPLLELDHQDTQISFLSFDLHKFSIKNLTRGGIRVNKEAASVHKTER